MYNKYLGKNTPQDNVVGNGRAPCNGYKYVIGSGSCVWPTVPSLPLFWGPAEANPSGVAVTIGWPCSTRSPEMHFSDQDPMKTKKLRESFILIR